MPLLETCFLSTLGFCGILSAAEMIQNTRGSKRASAALGMELRRQAQVDFEQRQKREMEAFLQGALARPAAKPIGTDEVATQRQPKTKRSRQEGPCDQMLRDGLVLQGAMQQRLTRYDLTLLDAQYQGVRCGVKDVEYNNFPRHLKDYVDTFGTTLHGSPQASRLLDELFDFWDRIVDGDELDTVSTASSAASSSDEDDSDDEDDEGATGTRATSVDELVDDLASLSSTGAVKAANQPKRTRSQMKPRKADGTTRERAHRIAQSASPRKYDWRPYQPAVDTVEPGMRFVVRVSP